MIKATINQKEFDLEVISSSEVLFNSESKNLDIIQVSGNKKHALIGNVSYSIETLGYDEEKKIVTLKVNNNTYQVSLKDKYDLLLKELGLSNMTTKVVKEIKAPMPGLVVAIQVEKGQEVKAGEVVLILEAMKMENVIKSPIDGVIKAIKTEKSNTVDKNAVLIEFE